MNRLSNRKNAGSKSNKRHKFVPTFTSDKTSNGDGRKSDHWVRFADITDCYPLAKAGHE